jgi:hypothetical protein
MDLNPGIAAQRWSFPGCHPGVFALGPRDQVSRKVTEAGVEPAKSRGSRPRRFSNLRTRPWRVRVMLPAIQAYETRMSTGPPASHLKLQAPVSNRAHRPYGSQLGTCRACIRTRMPTNAARRCPGHDVLTVACLPVSPHGHHQVARAGIEPGTAAKRWSCRREGPASYADRRTGQNISASGRS